MSRRSSASRNSALSYWILLLSSFIHFSFSSLFSVFPFSFFSSLAFQFQVETSYLGKILFFLIIHYSFHLHICVPSIYMSLPTFQLFIFFLATIFYWSVSILKPLFSVVHHMYISKYSFINSSHLLYSFSLYMTPLFFIYNFHFKKVSHSFLYCSILFEG